MSSVHTTTLPHNLDAYAELTENLSLSSQAQVKESFPVVGSQVATQALRLKNCCRSSSLKFGPTSRAQASSSHASQTVLASWTLAGTRS